MFNLVSGNVQKVCYQKKLFCLEVQAKTSDFSTLYLLCILVLWKYKLCIMLSFRRTVDLSTAAEVPEYLDLC